MKTNYGKGFLFALILAFVINTGSVFSQTAILSFEGLDKTASTTLPERTVFDHGRESVEIEYLFPGMRVSDVMVGQIGYQFLLIEGFSKMDQIGSPALPAHNDQIAIPLNADVKITILEAEIMEYDGYMIHPALEPAIDTYGAPDPQFVINEEIYNTDAYFPEKIVDVIDIQTLKECPVGIVQIRPVQFNPVTGIIKVYSKIKYKLEFISGSSFGAVNNSVRSNSMIKNIILNPASIPEGTTAGSTREEGKDYIIITHSQYQAAADTLANWKRQKGYTVEVVSQSSWTSAQVKDAIHSRYASWNPHPDYFVIIGDHDGSYAVPGELHNSPDNNVFASDLYYACMDGGSDYFPDMAHGRISVISATQALEVVLKMVNYERFPVTNSSFYSNAVNCAYFQDDNNDGYASRRFTHTSEDIRDYTMSMGFSVERIYYALSNRNPTNYNNGYYSDGQPIPNEITRGAGFDWDGGSSDITASINAGKFYVFHRDHGYVGGSGWAHPYYTTNQIPILTNGDLLPVVFSINCHTGEFRLSECFAEKFIRHTGGGAVGVIASSYYSYSGYNDGFSCGAIDAIWSDPGLIPNFGTGGISNPNPTPHGDMFTMGDVMNQALLRMTETWGTNIYTFELYHYFGDPAMEIWTGEPVTITANIPSTAGGTSITITGSTCGDALATAFFNGALIGETQLVSGNGTITFDPLDNNSVILITLSKHNYRPLIGESTVQTAPPDPPIADFSGIPTNIVEGESVSFSDLSLNNPTSWSWTFNGGTPASSTAQHPTVIYNNAGTYDVTLYVSNSADNDTKTITGYITVNIPPPVADFSASSTHILIGGSVTFTDQSTNNPDTWSWTFDGGTPGTSDVQNPAVTYDAAGVYDVTLFVTNAVGSDTETKLGYITVTDGSITYCESSSSNYSDDYISKVEFGNLSNTSSGSYYSDFTGLVMNAEPGLSYSMTLTPWKSNKVRKESWRVWIDYNIDGDFTDSGELIFAADRKRNPVSGTVTIPSDAFGQTRMRVSMQYNVAPTGPCAALSNGEVEDYTINFAPPVPLPPVANFSGSPTAVGVGNSVQFTDLSANNPTSWSWSFAGGTPVSSTDQHPSIAYNGIGIFSVTMTATNDEGSDTETKDNYITVAEGGTYCSSQSNSNALEWISQIDILSFSNPSGASVHSDFTDSVVSLSPGSSNPITLTPHYTGKDQREFWRVWIDFNGDNDFEDADEKVFQANNKKGVVSGTLNIPSYAIGNTRMRITMKNGSSPSACETFAGGEVEDYSVNFGEGEAIHASNLSEPLELNIYPNPVRETLNLIVNHTDDEIYVRVFSMSGKFMNEILLQNQVTKLDLSGYPQGMYVIFVVDGETLIQKKFIKK